MVKTASDIAGYQNKILHSNGDITYYNALQATEDLNEIMSRCWDSLPDSKKIEINRRIGG